ncbi:MAG: hypothetical protein ACE5HS_23105 [bacterium]
MAEEKKTKGKGCLIALAVVGVLFIIVAIGSWFVLKKAKNVFENFAEGTGVSPKMIAEAKTLNEQFPFQEPEDNLISERQITTFINIKKDFADKIKKHEAQFEKLSDKSRKEELGFKEIAESWKILGEIRRDFLSSLKRNKMSPKEYVYLSSQIYSTYLAESVHTGYEQMAQGMQTAQESYAEQLKLLEKQLQDPNIPEEVKAGLRTTMQNYETMMQQSMQGKSEYEQAYQKLPQQNIELLKKYRTELENLNTLGFEYWGLALSASAYEE